LLSRAEKETLVQELNQKLKKAKAVVLTDFKGLKVEEINELRKKFREAEVEYRVVKNTLIRLAAQDTPLEEIKEKIVGPNALAISYTDPVVLAKLLVEFKKKFNLFDLKSGFLEGKIIMPEDIEALAKLPSREVLLAQFLSILGAAPRRFVNILYGIIAKFLYVLEAIKQEKEKQNKEV